MSGAETTAQAHALISSHGPPQHLFRTGTARQIGKDSRAPVKIYRCWHSPLWLCTSECTCACTDMSPSTLSDDLFTVDSPCGEVRDTQRRGMWIEK